MPGTARRIVFVDADAGGVGNPRRRPVFSGHPAAIAPAPPSQPRDRSGLAPPSTAAVAPRASRRPGLSPDDDDFRKAAGTTRWMLPRADFLDWRLSKLFRLLFHFVLLVSVVVIVFVSLTTSLTSPLGESRVT